MKSAVSKSRPPQVDSEDWKAKYLDLYDELTEKKKEVTEKDHKIKMYVFFHFICLNLKLCYDF